MLLQQPLALLERLCLRGFLIGCERHLGVYDRRLMIGKLDDGIGTEQVAVAVAERLLQEVLLVLDQSAIFQRLVENHLAPVALHLRIALERLRERGGIVTDTLGLLFQLANRTLLLFFHPADGLFLLVVKFLHRLFKGGLYLSLVLGSLLAVVADGLLEGFYTFLEGRQQGVQAFTVLLVQLALALVEHLRSHVTDFFLHQLVLRLLLLHHLCPQLFGMRLNVCQFLGMTFL